VSIASPLLVRFDGVAKTLGERRVLEGMSFEIRRGEAYGLLGPNGSGKSTAIRLLAGLLAPDAGQIAFDGHPLGPADVRRLGVCMQDVSLYRELTPVENLEFFARLYGLAAHERRRRVDELVTRFELAPYAGTRVSRLSGGWQQRVHVAVGLVHSPDLLVLDEPTGAVDVQARHALWSQLEALRKAGLSLLLTTHQLDEAERLCTRLGVLRAGRLIAEGSPAELKARLPAQAMAFVATRDADALRERADRLGWPLRTYARGTACLLPQWLSLQEVAQALQGLELDSLAVQPVTLEAAYLDLLEAPMGGARTESAAAIT
jgi:ABC-2 type transport system ATP-binding protein